MNYSFVSEWFNLIEIYEEPRYLVIYGNIFNVDLDSDYEFDNIDLIVRDFNENLSKKYISIYFEFDEFNKYSYKFTNILNHYINNNISIILQINDDYSSYDRLKELEENFLFKTIATNLYYIN